MIPGGLPPSLAPAPANMGPAAMPQGNQGNTALALVEIRNAANMLQKALPMIPMGSPLHSDLLEISKKLSKHLSQNDESPGLQIQALMQMLKSQSQQAPLAGLSKLIPQNLPPALAGGAGGAPPGIPGAPPEQQAA